MSTMTRKQWLQELLTRSADGRFPSIHPAPRDNSPMCAYRDGKGNACAVGLLIPDEDYSASIEGASARHLLDHLKPPVLALPEGVSPQMVIDAQYAHDSTAIILRNGVYEVVPWDRTTFLNAIRQCRSLFEAFAAEGLVIE